MNRFLFSFFFIISIQQTFAQPVVLQEVLKPGRDKLYRNIIRNSINKNLSLALTDSTEDKWQDAFGAMELIYYRSPWADNKIRFAFDDIQNRSVIFQRSLLELGYVMYPGVYNNKVRPLLMQTDDAKIFAMCANYILITADSASEKNYILERTAEKLLVEKGNAILLQLQHQLNTNSIKKNTPSIHTFLQKDYLPGQVLLISFQRKNRNYPGVVLVRDGKGNFVKDAYGNLFSVPQLARSITNLPGYLTNGNTPEGLFRMFGFDQSKSIFIGPSNNIQLTMPFEKKPAHFYNNPALTDSVWTIEAYKKLLPENFKNYFPVFQSYYAGKAGRTEIIAHGTTINPEYYKGRPYYPLTPTQGCLTTKEIWSETTGTLLESDQQQLTNALMKAGGPYGYAIVIEIDDREENVSPDDIIPYLKLANQY